MKTWSQLLSQTPYIPRPLLEWWLSDYTGTSLTALPLQTTPTEAEEMKFLDAASRLAAGEPVQYVCGQAPFRNLELQVDPRVLIPRPETEQLVQIALERFSPPSARVMDVGTGSGCIALSIKQERPDCTVEARDISPDALAVARSNAANLNLDVTFTQAHLLQGAPFRSQELIIANLPYIGEKERKALPANVREFEPELALFSGPDGTDLILQLLDQAREVLTADGTLLLETGENQAEIWHEAAKKFGWKIEGFSDLAGRTRFWAFSQSSKA